MDIYVILKTNIVRSIKWPRLLWEAINLAKQDAVDKQYIQKLFYVYLRNISYEKTTFNYNYLSFLIYQ